jgi:hypothetical protein
MIVINYQTRIRDLDAFRNSIKSLVRPDGSIAKKQEELEEVVVSFYKDLFTTQNDLDAGAIPQHV